MSIEYRKVLVILEDDSWAEYRNTTAKAKDFIPKVMTHYVREGVRSIWQIDTGDKVRFVQVWPDETDEQLAEAFDKVEEGINGNFVEVQHQPSTKAIDTAFRVLEMLRENPMHGPLHEQATRIIQKAMSDPQAVKLGDTPDGKP